jgi:hypothetical protein
MGSVASRRNERDRPTVKQVYALAGALCERLGEEFPQTRQHASELIERLRSENGRSEPGLEESPFPWSRSESGRAPR